MKVKNSAIVRFAEIRIGEKKFPAAMQLAVIANEEAVTGALKAYAEVYKKTAEEYAKKDEDGNSMINEDGNIIIADLEAWSEALAELNESEVEVSITTIPKAVFERCCDDPAFDTPSVAETAAMSFFIEKE